MKSIVLHNTYLCMRHAQSIANEKHIIISDPETGISKYGLTYEGEHQVLQAIVTNKEIQNITHIYTSDFLRAYQTAKIVARHYNNVPIITDVRLRERYFGQFEGTHSENYHKVWDMDCSKEFDVACYNVESIHAVAQRMLSFVLDCEKNLTNHNILVVSHGDPLQILYAIASGLTAHQFKSLPPFTNAEVRILPSHFTIQEEYVS
ncbi:MAG: histidine phosphatase family protein [Spirochaetota bacterium]